MAQTELLKFVVGALDRLGVPSMLTGSLASSLQGEPRATHDIDLVIELRVDHIDALFGIFPAPDFYVSLAAMEDAVRTGGMFNVLDLKSGDKIDFWMLTEEPFDQSRFARKQQYFVDGVSVAVSSPEDTILMKLKWSKAAGESQVQYRDALHVYQLHIGVLDVPYIEVWAKTLGLADLWKRLQMEAATQ